MIVVCRNAEKRFDKPILSACNGYGQIFIENLLPNQRFGMETVKYFTVSTNYNRYKKREIHNLPFKILVILRIAFGFIFISVFITIVIEVSSCRIKSVNYNTGKLYF